MGSVSEVFTHATNFGSAVSGGLDPRTGLFNIRVALGNLVGNRNLGPSLPLELSYSPLTRTDTGFGQGVSLGLTTYDTEGRFLALSTGGQYMVQETDTKVILLQNKLDAVRITKEKDAYRVVHKSGSVEILTGPKNAFSLKVPTAVLTPAGHCVTLAWDFTGPRPRLKEVRDEHDTLLTADYTGTSKTTLHVLPGRAEGYSVDLRFRNGLLGSVHHFGPGSDGPLVWEFAHTPMGEQGEWGLWITGVTMPGGMSETAYYRNDGHQFPAAAHLPPLPCVYRCLQVPGGGQPVVEASYSYTDTNFLGGHSNEAWDDDKDNLYDILTGYSYGSTEERVCGGQTTRTVRTYNHFHLQTAERSQQNGCSRHVQTEYYAVVGQPFEQQPVQFQLPKKRTVTWTDTQVTWTDTQVTWTDTQGGPPREEVTETTFDTAGNPQCRTDSDGGVTEWVYYPSDGSEPGCPPDPNGFVRLLKSVTRRPAPTEFDAPVYATAYRYAAFTGTPDPRVPTALLKTEEWESADGQLLKREEFTYSTSTDEFGRITSLVETEYPGGSNGPSYPATHSFTFGVEEDTGALVQKHSVTSYDGLRVTRSQKRSRFTGRLWSATDAQGNVATTTYDGLGRELTHTQNPGTPYQAGQTHAYAIGGTSAPFVETSTDALGNQLRETLDGADRPIKRERKDTDSKDGTWYTIQTQSYDEQGRLSSITALDQVRGGGQLELIRGFSYDDWGQLSATTYSNGASLLTQTDPVALTTTTQRLGGGTAVTGRVVTTHNTRGEPVKVERFTLKGTSAGQRSLMRDGWGRLRRETDELGNTTQYDYDPHGRLVRTTLPDGTQLSRTYAPFTSEALITGLTVGMASYGTQSFDGLGRLTATSSGGRSWSYRYAQAGDPLPSTVTAPDQQGRAYQYIPQLSNALSQMKAGSITQTFTRDPVSGSLTNASDGSVTIARVYYASGLLHTDTTKLSGQPDRTATWSYTVGGLGQSHAGVDGTTQQITRDAYGRISKVEDPDMEASLTYDTASRLTGWVAKDKQSGHTLATALTWDDFGREVNRTITDSQGMSWTLTQNWQQNDLLSSRTIKRGNTTLRDEAFTYSGRNQLATYVCRGDVPPADAHGNKVSQQTFTYDAYGNITSCKTTLSDGSEDTATYSHGNQSDRCQLTSITHTHASYPSRIDLSYDAAGRLTKDDAGRTLIYDALGRLQAVGSAGSYGYDPLDRLLTQTTSGATSVLYYRGARLASVIDSGQSTRLLQLGQACVAQHRSEGNQAETRLLGTDGKRTVLVAATGQQHEEFAYTAYGYRPMSTTSVLGFDGQRTDPATGWYHLGNGARAYNPGLMRFTTPDTLSPFGAGGINPYTYCLGDPINRTDPSGHLSWQAWLGIGLGIAGLALTVVTGGMSIVAAEGVMAAISAASTTTLVVGALGVVSDVTSIASGALEEASPKASSILGYVSLGTGLSGLAHGGVTAARTFPGLARRAPELAEDIHLTPLLRGQREDAHVLGPRIPVEEFDDPTDYLICKKKMGAFQSTLTPGGTVWHSRFQVGGEDWEPIVEDAVRNNRRITVLTGLHGAPSGRVWQNAGALETDLGRVERMSSHARELVTVVNVNKIQDNAEQLAAIMANGEEKVAAFCHSSNAPFILRATRRTPVSQFEPIFPDWKWGELDVERLLSS